MTIQDINLVRYSYRGIDLSQFTDKEIKTKALFIRNQNLIKSFANTEAGKHYLYVDKSLKDLPIISVTPNAIIHLADVKNGKPILTADFWADTRIAARVELMLSYFGIAQDNDFDQIVAEDPYKAFLHFAGYERHKRLPQILLSNQDFTADADGKGNLQYNGSTDFATTRAFTGTADASSDVGFGSYTSKYILSRMFMPTDFSAIGASPTGVSATVKVTVGTAWDTVNDANSFCTVVTTSQASNTALATNEYDNINHTDKATSGHRDYTGVTADSTTFHDLALSDVTDITGTGYVKYGLQDGHDLNNTANSITAASGSLSQLRGTRDNAKVNVTWTPGGTAYTKTLTETIVLVDTLAKKPVRTLSEVITTVDTLIKKPTRILSDTIVMVDTLTSQVITYIERLETITIVDTLTRFPQKVYSEVITTTDTLIKTVQRAFSEAVTLTDTLTNGLTALRTLTETVSITDTLTRFPKKVLSEVIVIVDTLATNRTKNKTLTTETITLTDTLSKKPTKLLSEVITVTDSIRRHLNGLLVNLWSKIGKVTGIWTKVDKQE